MDEIGLKYTPCTFKINEWDHNNGIIKILTELFPDKIDPDAYLSDRDYKSQFEICKNKLVPDIYIDGVWYEYENTKCNGKIIKRFFSKLYEHQNDPDSNFEKVIIYVNDKIKKTWLKFADDDVNAHHLKENKKPEIKTYKWLKNLVK